MTNSKSGEQLRELVAGLQTRPPQEIMGQAATSSLVGSTLTAAIGLIGFVIVATALIFTIVGPPATKKKPQAEPVAAVTNSTDTTPATDVETTAETLAPSESATPVEAMGIGETKDADAGSKPLENRIDDLLKGLE